jgi:hypothetical protein
MKGIYMPMIVTCILLFSGCASREQTESVKENTSEKTEQKEALAEGQKVMEETSTTTTSENIFTSTTHQHNPEKTCEYPADAFSACDGKADNEPCEYKSTEEVVSGKCATEPCGKLVCKKA